MIVLSLRIKLILAFSIVAITAVAGIVLFANLDSERQVRTYLSRGGQYGLTNLVTELENYYETNNSWEGVDSILEGSNFPGRMNNQQRGNSALTLTDAKRKVLWSASGEVIGAVLDQDALVNAIQLSNSRNDPLGYLLVANSPGLQANDLSPFVERLKSVILYSGIVAAILAIVLAIVVSNYLLKPVKALTRASTDLSAGKFSTRVQVKGNDELSILAKTFNGMAANLESAEERKKTLTADVAHELRTPIAVQKAQLEGMIDGVLPVSNENLVTALQQTDFLSRMVDDLRLLAMADAGEVSFEYRETDLVKLIDQTINRFKGQVISEGTRIVNTYDPKGIPLMMMTDPDRLTQILNNLVSNALRYGKKGGVISIFCKVQQGYAEISVKDDGAGLPQSAIPHLFERFYRHEKARSREDGGTGLGLAISKKMAILMGGDLKGANHPEGGAVFTLIIKDHQA